MYDPKSGKRSKLGALHSIAKKRAAEGHASVPRQVTEIAYLWLTNGLSAPDYFCNGLYRTELTWRDKVERLGGKTYLRRLSYVNDKRYDFFALDKTMCYGLMRAFNVPTPEVYAVVGRRQGVTHGGKLVNDPAGLTAVLREMGEHEVCFKLVRGWTGKGFHRMRLLDDRESLRLVDQPDGRAVSVSDFWRETVASNGSYMVQRVIQQHPDVAAFHPPSVNTTRMWMVQLESGSWTPYAAVFRMGVGDAVVDNAAGRSLIARVDTATGALGVAVEDSVNRPSYRIHPTTNHPIAGTVLPMWEQLLDVCHVACGLVPFLSLVGFDVAFGDSGPLVLELESMPGDDQVGFDRGVKTLFRRLSRTAAGRWNPFG